MAETHDYTPAFVQDDEEKTKVFMSREKFREVTGYIGQMKQESFTFSFNGRDVWTQAEFAEAVEPHDAELARKVRVLGALFDEVVAYVKGKG